MAVNICGNHQVYITHNHCDECEAFNDRLEYLEGLVWGKRNVTISITDANGDETVATVLARLDGDLPMASNAIGEAIVGLSMVS